MSGDIAKVKILIVDDHPIVRRGLRAVLASRENLEVVGDAADGAEALRKVMALLPDIVLMDINMPGMDGLKVTEALHEKSPQIKVLVLSMHNQREAVSRIIQAGARGYVLKGAPPAELLRAIESVQAGVAFFSPSVARTATQRRPRGSGSCQPSRTTGERCTTETSGEPSEAKRANAIRFHS